MIALKKATKYNYTFLKMIFILLPFISFCVYVFFLFSFFGAIL